MCMSGIGEEGRMCVVFFFEAEDGIRKARESRGDGGGYREKEMGGGAVMIMMMMVLKLIMMMSIKVYPILQGYLILYSAIM